MRCVTNQLFSDYTVGTGAWAIPTGLYVTIPEDGYWDLRAELNVGLIGSTEARFSFCETTAANLIGKSPKTVLTPSGNLYIIQTLCIPSPLYLTAGTIIGLSVYEVSGDLRIFGNAASYSSTITAIKYE